MKLRDIAQEIHEVNKSKGFWDKERNIGESLMLVVSELGEAIEAHRNNQFADTNLFLTFNKDNPDNFEYDFKTYLKDTFEDELSDAIIRLLDLAEGLNIDLEFHIRNKLDYNKLRPRLHGKTY